MPRRKKFQIPVEVVRNILIGIFVLFLGGLAVRGVYHYLTTSSLFLIEQVVVESSIDFVDTRPLQKLQGKNIFQVDLKTQQRRFHGKYPQISDLKLVRKFPNQIHVVATRRTPLAQIRLGQRVYTIDEQHVVLHRLEQGKQNLPLIVGLPKELMAKPGMALEHRAIKAGVEVVDEFVRNRYLTRYHIKTLNVSNLSKIYVSMDAGFDIIIDREDIANKLNKLKILLAQNKLNFETIRYIDLRFKEPVVGQR